MPFFEENPQRKRTISRSSRSIAVSVRLFKRTHLLATTLRTPLQIQLHLTLALDVGYQAGEQPISADLVENVLSKQLNDLEPTLTRHGYRVKDLVEQFDARPAELKALFNNQLDPTRTAELRDRMLAAGLPIGGR
jgi:hypothetical protein